MSGSTPGPWQMSLTDDTVVIHVDAKGVHHEVANISGDYNEPDLWPIMEANARLIAAAPDLLAASEDMLSGWRYIRQQHGDLLGVGWDRAEHAARAAIAKATGGAA